MTDENFSELVGRTITAIEVELERVKFALADGRVYALFHSQDCCESVYLEDVNGDWDDLVNSPITLAEESTNSDSHPADAPPREWVPESFTWTFYRLGTVKGTVVMRWFGESNGYYSESVRFARLR